MYHWPNICFIIVTSIALITQVIIPALKRPLSQLNPELSVWLIENKLEHYAPDFAKYGHVRLIDMVEISLNSGAPVTEQEEFTYLTSQLKHKFILKHFLMKNNLDHLYSSLEAFHITSIYDIYELLYEGGIVPDESQESSASEEFSLLLDSLPKDKELLDQLCSDVWNEISRLNSLPSSRRKWTLITLVCLGVGALLISSVALLLLYDVAGGMTRSLNYKNNFLHLFTGKYLHPQRCAVTFLWSDPAAVGNTVSFVVQFFQRNGRPYPISNADGILIEITQGVHKIGVVTELGGTGPSEVNVARCKFTSRRAGEYSISILVANQHIRGSPFHRRFLPGPPDPSKILMVHHTSTLVCTASVAHHILIEPRDAYHNLCVFQSGKVDTHNYAIDVKELEGGWPVNCCSKVLYDDVTRRIDIQITLQRPGCYEACVTYCKALITNGKFEIIVLTDDESSKVQKTVLRRSHEGYEARLLPPKGSSNMCKAKKVYCYVTPKQLIVKEFIFKLIPKRVCTFRLCPSTKFSFDGTSEQSGLPALSIDDGCQPIVSLCCKERNVIAATFTQFMLKNIGGSETFKDKQDHFYHEIRKHHLKRHHERLPMCISRDKLLDSSLKSTKNFTITDWCKNFEITFNGEEGLDWGGLRREWFEIICVSLFDPANELFVAFHDGPQALVHPNPNRPKHLKLKHYEFAGRIVGKCLYESALGGGYRLSVRARFTRSFLAQLIGLRVHFKHFAQDDPDLYSGKILHLLHHGPDSLEDPIYFLDEVLINGQVVVIELEPGGINRKVTNENKLQYLDALAQSRLCTRVKQEVDAFLTGLNEIVPDNLLCIFDENELELLMCGIEEYSIADFKANHVVNGSSPEFNRVLYWFWTAVSNFTEEEMARLLQFTTGCSRLPPGGFAQLSPHFQISSSHTYDNLPTAHTCFNQLCLPDYDSYEHFEKALLLAIKEGSEGFGMV